MFLLSLSYVMEPAKNDVQYPNKYVEKVASNPPHANYDSFLVRVEMVLEFTLI